MSEQFIKLIKNTLWLGIGLLIIESITLFAFFIELKEKKQSRWLFQSQICRIWAS
jgi:hypothetical protein